MHITLLFKRLLSNSIRHPLPRPETTADILQRAIALCPELSPAFSANPKPTVEDIKSIIIEEGCGLRPGRKGGIRLESSVLEIVRGAHVPVVHNYGYVISPSNVHRLTLECSHGGYGYQSSWGSASIASELLDEALAKSSEPPLTNPASKN